MRKLKGVLMDHDVDFSNRTWRDIAKGLFMEIRIIPVLVWAFTSIVIGTALAYVETGMFTLYNFILAMSVACIVQGYPTHAANEIVDWLSGTDEEGFGGSKVIREGLLSVRDLKIVLVVSMSVVVALSALVVFTIDMRLIWFGIVGIAASLFYSLPPFKLAYRPFAGEWIGGFVGIFVAVTGGYYIQAFELSPVAVLAGVAVGVSDIAIMEMFHTIDYKADKDADPQKKTTMVFLGRKKGQIYVIAHICGAAFLLWVLTSMYWQFVVLAVGTTMCIYFYCDYNPVDPWSIIHNTKKVTWFAIDGGVIFATLINVWFALLSFPVILGYVAHKKWGKLPKN